MKLWLPVFNSQTYSSFPLCTAEVNRRRWSSASTSSLINMFVFYFEEATHSCPTEKEISDHWPASCCRSRTRNYICCFMPFSSPNRQKSYFEVMYRKNTVPFGSVVHPHTVYTMHLDMWKYVRRVLRIKLKSQENYKKKLISWNVDKFIKMLCSNLKLLKSHL